jgi:serine/threonine-protein kinase
VRHDARPSARCRRIPAEETTVIGQTLGPYRVVSKLGSGGMGEVYRARDTKLGREVALKVLPAALASDPDRLMRFDREARTLAALNHPHIAQVYGIEESGPPGGVRAIVMELVDGEDLSQRMARGALPPDEALPIARQITEALEAAHDAGIVHRDLKPANVKVRPDGAVKVLDFGLAKALAPEGTGALTGDAADSPTVTSPALTQRGVILGTVAYMAPEQARGRPVDRRADVWAFGVVLFEMLTGTRLFTGDDLSDTMAAVLRQPIVLAALPSDTPAAVRWLLGRCLERDPRQRLRDIGEARVALEGVIAGTLTDEPAAPLVAPSVVSPQRSRLPWILLAATVLVAAFLLWPRSSPTESPGPATRIVSPIGVPGSLMVDAGPAAVLSPDGRTIVFRVLQNSVPRLFVRRLDQLEATELAGTENATNPFFSPDGTRLGFFASGGLRTIAVVGGATTTLADAGTGRGAAWDGNGEILFQSSLLPETPLVRITGAGALTDRGTTLAPGEVTHRWPQILPDGRVLYSSHSSVSDWNNGTLSVQVEPGGPGKVLLRGAYHGRYVETGHLLYVHAGTLYGVRVDPERLDVVSQPVALVDNVVATPATGGAQYSMASDGTLVYVPGDPSGADGSMYWMTAEGRTSPLKTTPGAWGNPRFSPDGRLLAMQLTYGSHDQIVIYDWANDRLAQLTHDAANHRQPVWTPDGQRIVYSSDAGGPDTSNLYWRRADGSGTAERLTNGPTRQAAPDIHPDGRSIAYSEAAGATPADLWLLPLEGTEATGRTPGTPRVLLSTPALETLPAFSPDGRWIAYMSSEQGSFEIYVRRFEGEGGPWRVSNNGGAHPIWSRKSNELLYTIDDQIMTVPYRVVNDSFQPERSRPWSPVRYATAGPTRKFDLHPDGSRTAVASPDSSGAATYDTVVFIFNFFGELRRRLPGG